MIDGKFKLIKELGVGGSSKVFLASDGIRNQYAIKILRKDKKYTYSRGATMLKKEHWIMSKLAEHPNILNSFYSNPDGMLKTKRKDESVQYNVIELAENGPISKYVRITGAIEEELVKFIFLQLADAVRYIHTNGYAHLDIKLENILLDSYYNIKLADLGVSFELPSNNAKWGLRRGTHHYMAPEVMDLRKGSEFDACKADIFSLGVWLYLFLVGEFPDQDTLFLNYLSTNESDLDTDKDVEMGDIKNSTKNWESLSESWKDLLLKMLNPVADKRANIDDVLSHHWLQDIDFEEIQSSIYNEMSARKEFIANFQPKLK